MYQSHHAVKSSACKNQRYHSGQWKQLDLPHNFLVDEDCDQLAKFLNMRGWEPTLQLLFAQSILVLVEIEESIWNRRRGGLILGVVVRLEVGVTQGVFDRDTLSRVECKKLLEQIQGHVVALGEHCAEGNLLLKGEGANVFARTAGFDAVVVFHGWCAENVQDEGQLVVVCNC